MKKGRRVGTLILLLAAALHSPAARTAVPAPLFASGDEIAIELELPLRTVLRHRQSGDEVAGVLRIGGPNATHVLDVAVAARGHHRLETCAFPPLRLDFGRDQVADTLFAEQNRLKLVTLCRDTERYAGYLELEYFVYHFYEQIAEAAFRVRPSLIRYVETEHADEVRVAPAFFVEPLGGLAERLGWRTVAAPSLLVDEIEPRALARLGLFQFMIGKTDWAATQPTVGDDRCCHNADVLVRPAIEALLAERRLPARTRSAAANYLARSHELINDERELERRIVDHCLAS